MRHGIDAYFSESARLRRRVGWIGLGVAATLLGLELALMTPDAVRTLNDPKRFGFEGPDEYVHRILLETIGERDQPGANLQNLNPIELHAGGGKRPAHEHTGGIQPAAQRTGVGAGKDEVDLQSRLRALALEGDVIHSEDLVCVKLVRPEYPEESQAASVEGVVELFALVDTTGEVAEVHVAGGTHDPALERAATNAVLKCIYRPYRLHEGLQRVWAFFRIHFTLY